MKTKILIATLGLILSLVVVGLALANGRAALPRWILSGGTSNSTAGTVALNATLGQPVVGVVSDGDVTLGQGFWPGGSQPESWYYIYLPLIQK